MYKPQLDNRHDDKRLLAGSLHGMTGNVCTLMCILGARVLLVLQVAPITLIPSSHHVPSLSYFCFLALGTVSCHFTCAFRMVGNLHFEFCAFGLLHVSFLLFRQIAHFHLLARTWLSWQFSSSEVDIVQCSTYGLRSFMACTSVARGSDLVSYRLYCELRSLAVELICANKENDFFSD
jgi:hypothetical protein